MKEILLLFTFLTSFLYGKSQLMPDNKIVPISPNAASLGIYGQSNTSLYTGSANISIPIYTINLDGKDIPIFLSYSSTGTKVAQEASWVGLGWNLNAGGIIVRNTKGFDDFKSGGYFWDNQTPWNFETGEGFELTQDNRFQYEKYFSGIKDSEPDIFTFNCGSLSGNMFFEKSKLSQMQSVLAKPVIHSADVPADITYNTGLGKWTLIDGQGYTYYFGTKEETKSYSENSETFKGQMASRSGNMQSNGDVIVTSWLLDSIESPKKNKVYFQYKSERINTPVQMTEEAAVLDQIFTMGSSYPRTLITNYNYSSSEVTQFFLSAITFSEGRIDFKTSDRSDIELSTIYGEYKKAQKLSGLEVRNLSGEIIKNLNFNYHYLGQEGLNSRLLLDSVSENVQNNVSRYLFRYNEGYLPPKYSLETDAWGYYNGSSISTDPNVFKVIPTLSKVDGSLLRMGADKAFKEEYVARGVLNEIVYPTGGRSEFTYEPHIIDVATTTVQEFEKVSAGFIDNFNTVSGEMIINQKVFGEPFDIGNEEIKEIKMLAGHDNPYPENSYPNDPSLYPSIFYTIELQKWNGTTYTTVASNANIKVVNEQPVPLNLALDRLQPIAGKYRLAVSVRSEVYEPGVYVWTSVNYIKLVNKTVEKNSKGAGLRVSKIKEISRENKEQIKEYAYSKATLMSDFDYNALVTVGEFYPQAPQQAILSYYLCRSFPYTQFASTGKGSIGYSTVTEKTGNGKIVYNFVNQPDRKYNDHLFPGLQSIPNFNNGSIISMEVMDANDKIVKKEENIYTMREQQFIYGVKYFSTSILSNTSTAGTVASYPLEIQNWRKLTKTVNTYDKDGNSVKEIFTYGYDSFLQENSISSVNAAGLTVGKKINYAKDYDDGISTKMVNRFMVSIPVESMNIKNDKIIAAEKYVFKDTLGMILPSSVSIFASPQPQTIDNYATFYRVDRRFNKYNAKGNLIEMLSKNNFYTSIIWDTKNLFPIAKVENSNYNDAIIAFNGFNMSGLVLPNVNSENLIRTRLPKAMVSSYTYKPLVGMTSKTDPRGVTEYYEYDGMQRLKAVLDQVKNVTTSIDYHYRSN